MKEILSYPSYADLHSGCGVIVQKCIVKYSQNMPTTIVALSRGGLFPGLVISHMLEKLGYDNKLIPVTYSSKSGNGDGKNHNNVLPIINNADILIVDDIADGGNTMSEVVQFYQQCDNWVTSATLYYKESSIHTPELYWQKIPADSPWIIFNWEL